MAHPPSRRRGASGDEPGGGLGAAALRLVLEELRRLLLGRAADLADHDDRFGFVIGKEPFQHVDVFRTLDRIAADADAGGLAEAGVGGLEHCLVGQRARARHHADRAPLVNVAGHDADLAGIGRDDSGAVRADQDRVRALERAFHLHHVEDRNPFGDADNELHPGIDRLEDRIGGEGRRHVDCGGSGSGLLPRLGHGVEDGEADMSLTPFPGSDAAHHLRSVGDCLFGMEGALRAGKSLADHLGVLVDEDRHYLFSRTAATIFSAASPRSSAAITLRPLSLRIFLPSSTFVPSSRTTSGTCSPTSFTAAITPSAITSQRMMPPKMLTRIPFTFGSLVMILNAAVTFSLEAPPPTSRKFAGSAP